MKKYLIIVLIFFIGFVASYLVLDILVKNSSKDDSLPQLIVKAKLFGIKNKKQCLSKYWDTYKECTKEFCYEKSILYVGLCLRGARGDKDDFCRSNLRFQEEYISLHQKVKFCDSLGIDVQHCKKMYGVLKSYCS